MHLNITAELNNFTSKDREKREAKIAGVTAAEMEFLV
jgi:hypothetical protein